MEKLFQLHEINVTRIVHDRLKCSFSFTMKFQLIHVKLSRKIYTECSISSCRERKERLHALIQCNGQHGVFFSGTHVPRCFLDRHEAQLSPIILWSFSTKLSLVNGATCTWERLSVEIITMWAANVHKFKMLRFVDYQSTQGKSVNCSNGERNGADIHPSASLFYANQFAIA